MASSSFGPPVGTSLPAPSSTKTTEPTGVAAPPPTAAMEKAPDDTSKLKTLLSILRNIGDSEDPLGRMLAVLRFWFTKDLKYVKGRPCKPYNSTLGEFFRCNWVVEDVAPPVLAPAQKVSSTQPGGTMNKPVTVSFLTEQTSHHPPVSAYWIECLEKGISARGFDQLSAKFTGTSLRVTPGAYNHGIFITLHNWGEEEYQLTHPAANLGGLLRGSLSITVSDTCFITCPKSRIKVILHYLEEGWLGKTQNKVEGVIYTYNPENDAKKRIKDVPEKDILAKLSGCWYDKVFFTLAKSREENLLVDLAPFWPAPKIVPPLEEQLPNESRKFWYDVTQAIVGKEFGKATVLKQELEEKQREKAAERKANNQDWHPRFFTGIVTPEGRPELSKEGIAALRGLQEGQYHIQPSSAAA
ncbi:MAG: hypothetical protein M1835_007072 [Candelina submexicana]|nr:MAG: hypothetical protein M1835_007072 [Candelina submexicana]